MMDLEQALRAEFQREAAEAPDPGPTERYALSLVAEPAPRRVRRWLLPAVAALLLAIPVGSVVAIRAGSHHATVASADPSELYGTSWTLSRYVTLDPSTGKIVSESVASTSAAPTLQFTGRDGYHYFACTEVTGLVNILTGVLEFKSGSSNLVGCRSSDARVNAEITGMSLLSVQPLNWQISDHLLTISAADGQQLTFVSGTGSPNPSDLYDEDWALDRWVKSDGSAVSYLADHASGPLSLQFDGRGGYLLTDCNGDSSRGSAHVTSGRLTMAGVPNRLKCQTLDPAANRNLPTNVLQLPDLSWRVHDSVLTITAPGGDQLIFDALALSHPAATTGP